MQHGPLAQVRWWGRSLGRRYALTFVLVVSLPLLVYGLLNSTLTFRQQRAALAAVQQAQADASAARIQQFLNNIELQLAWLTVLPWTPDAAPQRRLEALRVLRRAPAITDLVLLDEAGRERVAESRYALQRLDSLTDRSASPAFAATQAQQVYYGDVTLRKGSEPFVTVAVGGAGAGTAIAEVSLKHIWDVVSRIHIGKQGIAYVVDRSGRLIAHPDFNLVLRDTNLLSSLRAFEAGASGVPSAQVLSLTGSRGSAVLASSLVMEPTGWRVVVEQPHDEADEPLRSAVHSALWVGAGSLLLALCAGLGSAWHMAQPLRALARSAARIGAGDLAHRIELHSGDEVQELGDRFNTMASELQASYTTLEHKVVERTRELHEANRAKSRLMAAASHDLRQPLHALNLTAAQLASETDPHERERLARRVEATMASVNALFAGLLEVSKLDAGAVQPQRSVFLLQRIFDLMDVALASTAAAKGIALKIRPSTAWVHSDPVLLERIVGNLMGNAVRYTGGGGSVLVAGRRCHGQLRIEVWDTGIGIAPDKLSQVFEEFYQVASPGSAPGMAPDSASASAPHEGLGLGLTIVARLSALLGHEVQLRSVLGRGSCFSVTVPQAAPESLPPRPVQAFASSPLDGRRLLLIDNDPQVLESTAQLLRSWGCQVRALGGYSSGKNETQGPDGDGAPDLILVDMHLDQGEDGVSVVARLRSHYGRTTPALIMSGDVSIATRDQITRAGLSLLNKPVSALQLRTVLTRLLQGS